MKLVLNNIRNLLKDLGKDNVAIELVVNGMGVKVLQKGISPVLDDIVILSKQDVMIAICENSLHSYDLMNVAFLDVVVFVSSGIGELVKKQNEGWVYIKP